ncbi:MAG: glycine--tRNA ligase subunit beta, partial [Nitrospiraceae bacterium]|nr:glycine--tRNA ligase subunit beta [Nitrospiraceae bacterium]
MPPKRSLTGKREHAAPKSGELLFEIGTEELPYQFVPPAIAHLQEAAERLLAAQRLTHGPIRAFGTPRRLVLVVESLADRQTPALKEVMG